MSMDAVSGRPRYGFLIGAPRRSSGKTLLGAGLCAELRRRGLMVRPYKKGPDYIDPTWLGLAADASCYNLDLKTQTRSELMDSVAETTSGGDHGSENEALVVEGNMALHDGQEDDGSDSNAGLAVLLGLPVVLIVDCRGMTRSVAAQVLGYTRFEPRPRYAGVVLNRVAGRRHEDVLRRAITAHTPLAVLGAIHENERLDLPERRQGLIPTNEHQHAAEWISRARGLVARQVDIDALLSAARMGAARGKKACGARRARGGGKDRALSIGIFRDSAFGFYYPDDIANLKACGARLVEIDSLEDAHLPKVDALLIGGGFPEMDAAALSANRALRAEVKAALDDGMPAYAECGGMMYLARTLEWHGTKYEMAGVLETDVIVHGKPCGKGYVRLEETDAMPWPQRAGRAYYAHEFHYSELVDLADYPRAYKLTRGVGVGKGEDGIVHKNLLASYVHQRDTEQNRWVRRFCAFIRQVITGRVVC